MTRQHQLLLLAAEAFDDGRDPFHESWLAEQNVTLVECQSLGITISVVLKGYLASSTLVQDELRLRGMLRGQVPESAVDYALNSKRMTELTNDLRNMGQSK